MSRLLNCCVAAALSLPLAASADPVTVVTQTSGLVSIGNPTLSLLNMHPDDYDFDGPGAAFRLHIETTIDVDEAGVGFARDGMLVDPAAQVKVQFTVGDRKLSYAGPALTIVGFTPSDWYSQSVFFYVDGHEVKFENSVWSQPGVLGTDPLAARSFDATFGLSGHFGVGFVYDNPDRPGPYLGEGADAELASLHVISAVPEPAHTGMLLMGLITLGALVRRRDNATWVCQPSKGLLAFANPVHR